MKTYFSAMYNQNKNFGSDYSTQLKLLVSGGLVVVAGISIQDLMKQATNKFIPENELSNLAIKLGYTIAIILITAFIVVILGARRSSNVNVNTSN
jgi:hypothetical protein